MTSVILCDRCGATFKKYPTSEKHDYSIDQKFRQEGSVAISAKFDLCDPCYESFLAWLQDGKTKDHEHNSVGTSPQGDASPARGDKRDA
jgi:hypothetical protein